LDPRVLTVCGVAFVSVFVLLAILSITIRLITSLYPAGEADGATLDLAPASAPPRAPPAAAVDPTLVAVISNTVMNLYPNTRVTRIEEQR
jgi:hypothetical protein